METKVRQATAADFAATRMLVQEAFEGHDPIATTNFLDALRAEGCILGEWVAEDEVEVVAHIVFSRVWIETYDGERVPLAMLTPLSVRPNCQRAGIGTHLMACSIGELERRGERVFVTLGHPTYYPRVGFRSELATGIVNPWGDTPAFMARGQNIPTGLLILPRSIAEAP